MKEFVAMLKQSEKDLMSLRAKILNQVHVEGIHYPFSREIASHLLAAVGGIGALVWWLERKGKEG